MGRKVSELSMLNRIELKQQAKALTKNARQSAYGMTLIFLLITAALDLIDAYVRGTENTVYVVGSFRYEVYTLPIFRHAPFPAITVFFVGILVLLLRNVLSAGYIQYHQGVRKGYEMPYTTLFDGFGFAGKIIGLHFVMGFFVFLWSMLFLIPGIIAMYRYQFAIYNLCENPELGIMEALNMSKQQTKGYKLDLFVLDLTFLGWILLSALTLGILSIWVSPYIQQTELGYFEAIKREKGIEPQPSARDEDDFFHPDDRF